LKRLKGTRGPGRKEKFEKKKQNVQRKGKKAVTTGGILRNRGRGYT